MLTETKRQDIERAFHEFTHRSDVGIVLINQHVSSCLLSVSLVSFVCLFCLSLLFVSLFVPFVCLLCLSPLFLCLLYLSPLSVSFVCLLFCAPVSSYSCFLSPFVLMRLLLSLFIFSYSSFCCSSSMLGSSLRCIYTLNPKP